jgi:hypothetical protein
VVTARERNTSTDRAQGRSVRRLHIESQKLQYAGLSRESGGEAQGHNTTKARAGMGAEAYRIPSRRMP